MNIINASSIHCVDNAFCDGHFGSLSLSISVQALSTINWWQRVPLKVRSSISLRWESSTTLLISNCSITLQHGRDLNGRCFVLIAIWIPTSCSLHTINSYSTPIWCRVTSFLDLSPWAYPNSTLRIGSKKGIDPYGVCFVLWRVGVPQHHSIRAVFVVIFKRISVRHPVCNSHWCSFVCSFCTFLFNDLLVNNLNMVHCRGSNLYLRGLFLIICASLPMQTSSRNCQMRRWHFS